MKKLILTLSALSLLSFTASCGSSDQGSHDEPEKQEEITGEYFNAGRMEVLVPEGWQAMEKTAMSDDFTAVIVKGDPQDFLSLPYLSVQYSLPSEVTVSAAAFYEEVIQREDFDAGEYHWKNWTGTYGGRKADVAEAEGDFGYLTVNLNNGDEAGETLSYDDPEVQAVLKNIKVTPTADFDWVKIEDGNAVITLKNHEGKLWEDASEAYSDGIEGGCSLAGNILTVTINSGTGIYNAYAQLISEDQTENWGDAEINFQVQDGKITGVYDAKINLKDTPESLDPDEMEDTTDYDALDQYLIGAWVNPANSLTMFIQKNAEAAHGYTFTIHKDNSAYIIPVNIQEGGIISYESIQINFEDPISAKGRFLIDGNMLIWSIDDAVIDFENATIFTKVQ